MGCGNSNSNENKIPNCIDISSIVPDYCISISSEVPDHCIDISSNMQSGEDCCYELPIPEFTFISSGLGRDYQNGITFGDPVFINGSFISYGDEKTIIQINNLSEILDNGAHYEISSIDDNMTIDEETGWVIINVPPKYIGNTTLTSYDFGVTFFDSCGAYTNRIHTIEVLVDTRGIVKLTSAYGNSETLYPDTFNNFSIGYYIYHPIGGHIIKIEIIKLAGDGDLSAMCDSFYYLTDFIINAEIDTSNIVNLNGAFRNCEALTSFPFIDTKNVTDIANAWNGCSSLTSFYHLDESSLVSVSNAWYGTNLPLQPCDGNTGFTFRKYLYDDGVQVISGDGKDVDCG